MAKIAVKGKRATGVVLTSGEEISARAVISNLDAKRTFLNLIDAENLPEDLVRRAQNFKIRGSSGKVNIALDGMPEFPALAKRFTAYPGSYALYGYPRAIRTCLR